MKLKPTEPMPNGWGRQDLLECAKAELTRRESEYPELVKSKEMTKHEAEAELGMMADIIKAVETHTLVDNADLCVAAMFIELKKYMHFKQVFDSMSTDDIDLMQESITRHIKKNIYDVTEIQAQTEMEAVDDIGL